MSQLKWKWVVDKCDLNILPSILNSLSKDGFEVYQISEPLNDNVVVIARKAL
jgi:hypothetical protein